MNGLPYFAFYANDFVGGVKLFTTEEVGAYMLLLCYQWTNGPLPKDQADLDRIACATVSQRVRNKFQDTEQGLVNHRLEVERVRGMTKKKNAMERLHRHRKNKKSETRCNGVAKPVAKRLCSDSDSHTTVGSMGAPSKPKAPTKREQFETAWKAYPDKSGSKEKAFAAFERSGDDLQAVLDGIGRYMRSVQEKRKSGFPDLRFKYGSTFFNGMEWRSEWQEQDTASQGQLTLEQQHEAALKHYGAIPE